MAVNSSSIAQSEVEKVTKYLSGRPSRELQGIQEEISKLSAATTISRQELTGGEAGNVIQGVINRFGSVAGKRAKEGSIPATSSSLSKEVNRIAAKSPESVKLDMETATNILEKFDTASISSGFSATQSMSEKNVYKKLQGMEVIKKARLYVELPKTIQDLTDKLSKSGVGKGRKKLTKDLVDAQELLEASDISLADINGMGDALTDAFGTFDSSSAIQSTISGKIGTIKSEFVESIEESLLGKGDFSEFRTALGRKNAYIDSQVIPYAQLRERLGEVMS